MFQTIIAIIKIIPIIDSWVKLLIAAYVKHEIEQQNEEFKLAIQKLFEEGDQRDLEKAIGSDNAGKPTKNRDGVEERPMR